MKSPHPSSRRNWIGNKTTQVSASRTTVAWRWAFPVTSWQTRKSRATATSAGGARADHGLVASSMKAMAARDLYDYEGPAMRIDIGEGVSLVSLSSRPESSKSPASSLPVRSRPVCMVSI